MRRFYLTISGRKLESGFTLVEMMIALVLMGVLAALAVNIFNGSRNKAKCADVETAVLDTMLTIEKRRAEFGALPANGTRGSTSATADQNVNIDGISFTLPPHVLVSWDNAGVTGQRGNPACNTNDGTYQLNYGARTGAW